jgi:hypothetical protein
MVEHMFTVYDEETGDNFFDLLRFYVDTNTLHPVGITFHYRDLNKIVKYQVSLFFFFFFFLSDQETKGTHHAIFSFLLLE